jgi:hypothetical protein
MKQDRVRAFVDDVMTGGRRAPEDAAAGDHYDDSRDVD